MLNISNHPSTKWTAAQVNAAKALDGREVVDFPFPNVPPTATIEDVMSLARDMLTKALATGERVAMVQGEFSLTFGLTRMLLMGGVGVVVATTERKVIENADGTKTVTFEFVQFRPVF